MAGRLKKLENLKHLLSFKKIEVNFNFCHYFAHISQKSKLFEVMLSILSKKNFSKWRKKIQNGGKPGS